MKKSILFLALVAVSCSQTEETPDVIAPKLTTLTFEDADYAAGENYLGKESWSSLIDNAEYGGELLYANDENYVGHSEYTWYDANNTELVMPELREDQNYGSGYSFAQGGIAVSNYVLATDPSLSYLNQLSVVEGGHNDSDNFAVAFTPAELFFHDMSPRVIDHLYINNTTYTASVCLHGNAYSESLGTDGYYKVIAKNVDENEEVVATAEFYLAKDGKLVEGWQKWDLTSLGKVAVLKFEVDSNVGNEWGISIPNYFAIDDIAVVME